MPGMCYKQISFIPSLFTTFLTSNSTILHLALSPSFLLVPTPVQGLCPRKGQQFSLLANGLPSPAFVPKQGMFSTSEWYTSKLLRKPSEQLHVFLFFLWVFFSLLVCLLLGRCHAGSWTLGLHSRTGGSP